MVRYVDLDKVIEEIDRRIKNTSNNVNIGAIESLTIFKILNEFKSFLYTLEVKEVDINKEIAQFIDGNFEKAKIGNKLSLRRTAKYFFELGMSASNKA